MGKIAISISKALQRSRAKPCFFYPNEETILKTEQEYLNKNSEKYIDSAFF